METNTLSTSVELINQKVKFACTAKSNPPVIVDYTPPLGDSEGYTSLELILISLSTCIGTAVIALLKKMHKEIDSFVINAEGVRRTEHPTGFKTITVDIQLAAHGVSDEEMVKILAVSEESICPVWNMLKGNVEIITKFKIDH